MLQINDLTVAYSNVPVFKDLSVKFAPGKITGIIGPNGAGKSTLIKGALGLVRHSGQTTLDGVGVNRVRQKIAYVEQRAALDLTFPISVFEVVLTGTYGKLGLFKSPGREEKEAARNALKQVNLLEFEHRQIGELSGGQLQRVFVARAIVQQADVVILDEPFVGIDMKSEEEIMNVLRGWRDDGKSIIVVHHDLNKVAAYFDDLLIMNHGIIAHGPVATVYTQENIQQAFSADLSAVLFNKMAGA
ncbi:metal ABC transporter ATP-binding protein [Weissella bombi]|uniref:Iron/zinc/copper transport system ATP-binding protein n=1 Tax=Weissella bombi TaxID=1505725 RepID=A0A1C4A9L5_9LACO|nr:metal ABC transporter ATP-binding protein [Weissella bombi]SCB91211.1 iron/zinc/copper transport system ATP-binding protein [Weissella bombi]